MKTQHPSIDTSAFNRRHLAKSALAGAVVLTSASLVAPLPAKATTTGPLADVATAATSATALVATVGAVVIGLIGLRMAKTVGNSVTR
jgi:Zn-dependent alcohol dehydrogenase